MPDTATWDDIMYQCYVQQKIEAGIKAADAGETISHEEMQRRFPTSES
jgi:predicted transcriptional regulator